MDEVVFSRKADRWTFATLVLLLGYLTLTRSFAYLGLPTIGFPIPLYIGEAFLAAFLIFAARVSISRWVSSLVMPSRLSAIAWLIYFFVLYGVFELIRGVYLEDHPLLIALQGAVFSFYALFFFLGLWVGEKNPDFLGAFIRKLAWVQGVYGIAWILFLTRFEIFIPGTPGVPLFGQPAGSYFAILGLLCFERNLSRMWVPLLLNTFVLLALQVRGGWAGFLAGLITWAIVTKRFGRFLTASMVVVLLLIFGYVFDLKIPETTRGNRGEISARNIVGAVVAPIDKETALEYSVTAKRYAGTAEWRTDWWNAIWRSVHEDPVRSLIGHGYGFPLTSLVPFLEGRTDLRTPHGVFFYALGYGGWVGVLLFAALLTGIGFALWRVYRLTGNPFGLVFIAIALGVASFGDFFETPFGGIPFYIIVGLACAPGLGGTDAAAQQGLPQTSARSLHVEPLSV
jgi:hypothetical protein